MAAPLAPALRRALRLSAYVAMTLGVYWANDHTPPEIRFGILYIVPVLLVTWTEGLAWGVGFAVVTIGLREVVAWDQLPAGTPLLWRLVNAGTYVVVLAVGMAGLQRLRHIQRQLSRLATHDPLTSLVNARTFAARLTQELERNRRYPRPLALL